MNEVAPQLQQFWLRRHRLLVRLDELRSQIDAWFVEPENTVPSMHALAKLEGLLASRKTMLTELLNLDDDMLGTLVKIRGSQS
jgi:hypothetical protein